MIYFSITPSTVELTGTPVEDVAIANATLMEALKSRNPQAHMVNAKLSNWSEPVPYWWVAFDVKTQSFPRGRIFQAAKALHEAGLSFEVRYTQDHGGDDAMWWDEKNGMTPRDYQIDAVNRWLGRQGFGIVSVPTRGGKTLIGCLAASAFVGMVPVLWLVTKNEAKADVQAAWEQQNPNTPGLTVMTYATATKRDLSEFGMIIADEVHRAAADTYYEAIQGATNAWYRLGLTGTPDGRSDGKDVYITGAIGDVVYEIPRSLLIERKICSSGKTWRVVYDDPMHIPPDAPGNWTMIEKYGIVENDTRDGKLIAAAMKARGDSDDQILFMCRRKAHAERLAEKLSLKLGVEVPAMHSGRTKKQRQKIYEKLASGECRCVVATSIYDDSMTFPHLKILVVVAGGKSSILTGQRMGRVLAGDKEIIIIDCSDEHWETLRNHSKKRFRVYAREGYRVEDVIV